MKTINFFKLAYVLLLFTTTYISAFPVAKAEKPLAETLTMIYVSPKVSTTTHNTTFKIDINIRFTNPITSYQVYLWWDPTLVKVSKVVKGPFLSNSSMYSTLYVTKLNRTRGLLRVWESQYGGSPSTAVRGNGTFFSVTFTALGTGQCALHLNNTQLVYLTGELLHNVEDGFFNNKVHSAVWDDVAHLVVIESNSTVFAFNWSQGGYQVHFSVYGENDTVGYVNVTIPKSLLKIDPGIPNPPPYWQIFINQTIWMNITEGNWHENETHSFVYFTYPHSENFIEIKGNWVVPEFPQITLPLILIAITILILLTSKVHGKSRGTSTVSLRKTN